MSRRGFSLIEAIAAIVILALVAPVSMFTLRDAAASRSESIQLTRATWLAVAVMETVLGDLSSGDPALGFGALSDVASYLDTPSTGLRARLASVTDHYRSLGFEWTLTVGGLVAADGAPSGDEELDVYRVVRVTVSWVGAGHGPVEYPVSAIVCDTGGAG